MDFKKTLELVDAFPGMTSTKLAYMEVITLQHASNDLLRGFKMGLLTRKRLPQKRTKYAYQATSKGRSYLRYQNSPKRIIDWRINQELIRIIFNSLDKKTRTLLFMQAFSSKKSGLSIPSGSTLSALKKEIRKATNSI